MPKLLQIHGVSFMIPSSFMRPLLKGSEVRQLTLSNHPLTVSSSWTKASFLLARSLFFTKPFPSRNSSSHCPRLFLKLYRREGLLMVAYYSCEFAPRLLLSTFLRFPHMAIICFIFGVTVDQH